MLPATTLPLALLPRVTPMLLPLTRLPAPATLPPIVTPLTTSMKTPCHVLPRSANPDELVPM